MLPTRLGVRGASRTSIPAEDSWVRLKEFSVGERGTLVRVGAQDPDNLNLLKRLGLAPGIAVEVVAAEGRGVRVLVGKDRFLLPTYLAEMLWMERTES